MDESKEVQALESIASAVDDSQLKIILATQCIKAQSLLVTKLRKQSEHQKEVCNFINSGNLKLETEIRIAEQKIKSSITALDTIKSANVELQKDLLLSKERNSDIVEMVNNGIKKYESMWQEAKAKYENIPFIKHYIETKSQSITLKQNIDNLVKDSQNLNYNIKERKKQLDELHKKQILELANFLINERPKTLLLIQEKCEKMKQLRKVLNDNNNEGLNAIATKSKQDTLVNIITRDDETENDEDADGMVLPKLELSHIDFDVLTAKLNKIRKSDSFNLPIETTNAKELQLNTENEITESTQNNDYKMILIAENNLNIPKNYSEKKLIHILDDIKINKNETKEILAKVNKNHLKDVNVIEAITPHIIEYSGPLNVKEKIDDEVQEIDLSSKPSTSIGPPSQFLDITKGTQKSDNMDLDNSEISIKELDKCNKDDEDMIDIEIVKSRESERSYEKIKDTILKKHKLDLSPQFVYSKKPMVHNNTKTEIKSKFFDNNEKTEVKTNVEDNAPESTEIEDTDKEEPKNAATKFLKLNEVNIMQKDELPISGFLFNHGADGIVQLSNTSLDTTGYGDGENDFPHCIDSSLLLSPKADMDVQDNNANDVQVLSQEVPNFLTGIRKTGFSFFGSSTPDEASTSENNTQQSNFNFNFGGEEKKSRGGLFSMFR